MNASMRPAVFFDRDGVINIDHGYTYRQEDFDWMPGAKESIRFLNEAGYQVFVITNQSGVGRGYYTEDDVLVLHRFMQEELAACDAHIDAFYHCPHHPEAKVEAYRKECDCRKPQPGMILKALSEWPVDEKNSFLIGDKSSDLEAASAAGLEGFLFKGGNLYDFLLQILRERNTESAIN